MSDAELRDWPVHDLSPRFRVRITAPMPELPGPMEAEVERRWQVARQANPALFNGRIFSVDRLSPGLIEGHWTEFRRAFAQFQDPSSPAPLGLGLHPLAVCGAVRCGKGIVLGQRQSAAVYQSGLWQLPPAGGIDPGAAGERDDGEVDWQAQFLAEMREELGVKPAQVGSLHPVCLIEHPGTGVMDACIATTLALDPAALLAAHAAAGDRAEYQQLHVVPVPEAAALVQRLGGRLAPQSAALLARLAAAET